jgi:uncharacterized protein YacL
MTNTIMIILVVCFFILLYYGFRKIDRKLEALVRLNNKKIKEDEKDKESGWIA